MQVSFEEIANLLDPEKIVKTVQKFTDIYFHLPGLPNNGNGTESNWIRVRNCEGRFALLIREVLFKQICFRYLYSSFESLVASSFHSPSCSCFPVS